MNTHSIFRPAGWLLAIATLFLTLGCSPKRPDALRVGLVQWPVNEFFYLAREKGFFRDEGVEVQVVEFSALGDCRRAYERGQLDAYGATVTEVLTARDHSSRTPQIVHVMDYSDGADVIVARAGLTACADLKGRRVGLELSTIGVFVLARALEKNGMSLADITVVPMNLTDMEDAMNHGQLDAAVTFPPYSVTMLRDGKATAIFSSTEIPGEVVDVLALDAEIARTRPNDIAKLLRGFWRAVAYAEKNPDEAYRIMAARENITPAEFRQALADGIKMVPEVDQASYLRPGGKLAGVIDASDRILRQTDQVKGPDRRGDVVNGSFATGK